jgi:hypothetical protein
MGLKLIEYYDKAKKIGGINAIMKLAVITQIPSAKAFSAPDTRENIQSFENAMSQIKNQFIPSGLK